MQTTEHYQTENYGAPAAGEQAGAPRRRRKPSALGDPRVRVLVAGILEEKIADLLQEPSLADQFIADQLDDVANELRGTE